jgi:hypothetical protein
MDVLGGLWSCDYRGAGAWHVIRRMGQWVSQQGKEMWGGYVRMGRGFFGSLRA